jgi:aspartate/methionine/tyrosine aminotransferase
MRSTRLPADLTPNAAARALDSLRRRGEPFIDLTESNPTRVGLGYPPDLLAPLADPSSLSYDPQPLGLPAARAAASAEFARRGLRVPAEHVAITVSTSEAYSLLFKLLCDAGDVVLVPRPSYPLFDHLTVLESVEAVGYELEYHGTWRIDVDRLRAAADDRARAVLVVSPNNPTGSFLHSDDLRELAELCASRNLMLIGDEVFADFPLDVGRAPVSVLDATGVVSCSLGGLSKSVGLPQLKLGWIGFGGPRDAISEVLGAFEVIADTYLSVATPVQRALPELLERGALVRAQIAVRLRRNLDMLRVLVARRPEVSLLQVEGGWSAVLQVPSYRSEEALVLDLLTEDRVLVHPGYFFDFPAESFVVVSLLAEPARFDRGVELLLARAARAPEARQ